MNPKLIFLISQPRAGSTLTQKILGSHPLVHTTAEPWIMLHPLYALRRDGVTAEYNHTWARNALANFLDQTASGKEVFFRAIQSMATILYSDITKNTGKQYFLDKTPRYYEIIPELANTFPDAYFILLYRNPLAVLCSILSSFTKKEPKRLSEYSRDLLQAPRLLIDAQKVLADRALVVRYEDLITAPTEQVRKICDHLELNYLEQMINYGASRLPHWTYGDQKKVDLADAPDPGNLRAWETELANPQTWRIARDYLDEASSDTFDQLGYSYQNLLDLLEQHKPNWFQLLRTKSLASILTPKYALRKT